MENLMKHPSGHSRKDMQIFENQKPGHLRTVAYRGGEGVTPPPPEIPKAIKNRAKLNPIVKTVKNC